MALDTTQLEQIVMAAAVKVQRNDLTLADLIGLLTDAFKAGSEAAFKRVNEEIESRKEKQV